MVGVIRRMNKLKTLLSLRHGPGAAILPSEITRIHVEFASRWNDGHYGPRKFWRSCLPRLKYWNPAVPMIVNRTVDQAGPATMTVYFRQSSASSSSSSPGALSPVNPTTQSSSSMVGQSRAPEPSKDERVVTIDMKGLHSDTILDEFLSKTGAVPVRPTPQEEAELREVQEREERGQVDREVMRKHLEAERREASLMAQARNEAAAMKQAA